MTFEEKLANQEYDRIWQEYCGFLDLDMESYMRIQRRLLEEQIRLWSSSPLGQKIRRISKPITSRPAISCKARGGRRRGRLHPIVWWQAPIGAGNRGGAGNKPVIRGEHFVTLFSRTPGEGKETVSGL